MEKILFIVRGLPGSGKSTFAEKLVGHDFLVCEAEIKDAHESCRAMVEMYMHDSIMNDQFYREIAVSNTFTQEWEMEPYNKLAEKYGYKVFSVIVENRHGGVNTHGVPEDKLEIMKNRFEVKL
jgi:predicted kinase